MLLCYVAPGSVSKQHPDGLFRGSCADRAGYKATDIVGVCPWGYCEVCGRWASCWEAPEEEAMKDAALRAAERLDREWNDQNQYWAGAEAAAAIIREECAPRWTSDVPKVKGWYWRRWTDSEYPPVVVCIFVMPDGVFASDGLGEPAPVLDGGGCEWAGPIAPPNP